MCDRRIASSCSCFDHQAGILAAPAGLSAVLGREHGDATARTKGVKGMPASPSASARPRGGSCIVEHLERCQPVSTGEGVSRSRASRPRWRRPIALALALLLPGLGAAPFDDPGEGQHAEIAREILASGDWLTLRLNGVRYFDKPPLLYWLAAGAFAVLGDGEWAARLVPLGGRGARGGGDGAAGRPPPRRPGPASARRARSCRRRCSSSSAATCARRRSSSRPFSGA